MINQLTSEQIAALDRALLRVSLVLAVLGWGFVLMPALGAALDRAVLASSSAAVGHQ